MLRKFQKSWAVVAAVGLLFLFLIFDMNIWKAVFAFFFPDKSSPLYPNTTLISLTVQHLELVAISSLLTIMIGVPLGIWVTRHSGADFLGIVTAVTSFGQTFPPVAVLALAVPILGFGLEPTIVALFLYGLLPVVRNTIAGLKSVPSAVVEAASGIGMGWRQSLVRVELPLAVPLILAGIRISVVINIGTAMLGATIGAGGLGVPVIAGLVQNNIAMVLEGAIPAAVLAIIVNQILANLETMFRYHGH